MTTIEVQLLQAVSRLLQRRADDVESIINAGYSFEEWFNWEIFLEAKKLGTVQARPAYGTCGAIGSKHLGDLRLDAEDGQLLVEVAVVHDRTGDKWLHKMEKDRVKLSQPLTSGFRPVQILVCGSSSAIRSDPRWTNWLGRLSFWSAPTIHDEEIALQRGTCLLRAWRVP